MDNKKEIPSIFSKKELLRKLEEERKELERLRSELQKKKQQALEKEKLEKEMNRIKEFKQRMQEQQQKELEERKRFLESIKARQKTIGEMPPKPEVIVRPVPQKLSLAEKIWYRVIIVFLTLIIVASIPTIWYRYLKPSPHPAPPSGPPTPPTIVVPPSLIIVQETSSPEISNSKEIPSVIKNILKKASIYEGVPANFTFGRNLYPGYSGKDIIYLKKVLDVEVPNHQSWPEGEKYGPETLKAVKAFQAKYRDVISEYAGYKIACTGFVGSGTKSQLNALLNAAPAELYRIVIKNKEAHRVVNLKDFFESLGILPPQGFYNKVNLDATFFIWSRSKDQLGFIAEIKSGQKSNLKELLKKWEETMQKDFEPLLSIIHEGTLGEFSQWQTKTYQGNLIRYTNCEVYPNFGLYYTIYGSTHYYLIFTVNQQAILKIIDLLAIKKPGTANQ